MKGKKGSIEIDIPSATKSNNQPGSGKQVRYGDGFTCKAQMMSLWEFCKEDSNRLIFALKVALAILLVSLLMLCGAPYKIFHSNIIWSIFTVAIMFEYTVGATFNRGFNRALGSLLAGILAVIIGQLASCTSRVAEPYIYGISIFLVGTSTAFLKQWPPLVPYEYGFRVILFTFCLIVVSGYRTGTPIKTAVDRLYSIAIGGFVTVIVNAFVHPIWAGEQLHKELVKSFESVADSLEECVKKYLEDDGSHQPEISKTVMDEFPDEPAYRKCRATLNSSAKLDTLAVSAKWEPPHGRFRQFFYPWSEYVKVGAVLRYCAYEVMALHGVLHSEIQAPYNLRVAFLSEIQKVASQAAELVRSLGKDISSMKRTVKTPLLKRVHSSAEKLQSAIELHSYLLTSHIDTPLNPKPDESSGEQHSGPAAQPEMYHEMMRKQSRRLYSWPSREVHVFEEEGVLNMDFFPRMNALESTAALSLATFTSLLIEFVARLDRLVEAVEELSKMAKFKSENGPVTVRD